MRPIFEKKTGYIYFIQMNRIGPIKIGFAKDPFKRVKAYYKTEYGINSNLQLV